MSEKDSHPSRPRTRQAVKEFEETGYRKSGRKSTESHSTSQPDHIRKCFICYSEVERHPANNRGRHRNIVQNNLSTPSTSGRLSSSQKKCRLSFSLSKKEIGVLEAAEEPQLVVKEESLDDKNSQLLEKHYPVENERVETALTLAQNKQESRERKSKSLKFRTNLLTEQRNSEVPLVSDKSPVVDIRCTDSCLQLRTSATATIITSTPPATLTVATTAGSGSDESTKAALASSAKPPQQQQQQQQQQPSLRPPQAPVPSPAVTPPKPLNNIPLPLSVSPTCAPKAQSMAAPTGPVTKPQTHSGGALDGQHHQVSATSIDELTLDQCFQIAPKWHYIKSSHDETSQWLDSANFESILLELLYFAHDQGQILHKDAEIQFERELERAINSMEKLDCLDAFCKMFIRDNQFRPVGRGLLAGAGKDDKYNRLFRMINTDLQSLLRQHRILSMVCSGTADHEVHTLAQRENLRKLVEDLVAIVHPSDKATYSEVYKVIAENASFDKHNIKPHISSLKLVCLPDIMVPFGGPIMAGGAMIRCDALEQKIRAKLPSLIIKMHFSERLEDQKWSDLGHVDDSGIGDDTGTGSQRVRSREQRSDDKTGSKSGGACSKSSGKRKHEDSTPTRSKRHREDLRTRDTQPPDANVINEIYGEHVAQLICSLTTTALGYIKHSKYTVSPGDERDGTASVTVLGMVISGEDVYLTKMDASHDYLDSLVETFRMDHLSFSCMANPLNLYRGAHLKALLLYLRHICHNFPKTTYFLSD